MKINIDKTSFDNLLASLNNLDFEINSFKGIDINHQFDNGKYAAQRNLYGINFNNKGSNDNPLRSNLPIYNNDINDINNFGNDIQRRMNKSQDKKRTNYQTKKK